MVDEATVNKPFTAARDGFSINAGVGCEARERGKLERVCRYMARPAAAPPAPGVPGDLAIVRRQNISDSGHSELRECLAQPQFGPLFFLFPW